MIYEDILNEFKKAQDSINAYTKSKTIDDLDVEIPVKKPIQEKEPIARLSIGDLDIDKEEDKKSSIDDLNVDDSNEEINNLVKNFIWHLKDKIYESTPEKVVKTGFSLQEIVDYISAYDDIRKFILSVKYNCDNKWILEQADKLLQVIK